MTWREGGRKSRAPSSAAIPGDGVVLLTDMFGGTPSNLAISMMDRKGVEVIAGVNLPMLVKLAKVRSNQPLADRGGLRAGGGQEIHRRRLPCAARLQMNGTCG